LGDDKKIRDMTEARLFPSISVLPENFAISRLGNDAPLPDWAVASGFFSITRTGEELSVVCPQAQVPEGIRRDDGWRCLKVEGPLDFSVSGVLSSIANPLAKEGISIFAISTYDTDYLLVKEENLEKAVWVLSRAGYQIEFQPPRTQRPQRIEE
jgi:hypothetical protein